MPKKSKKPQEKIEGICMRCKTPTTRITIVGCVCERCATEINPETAVARITKAANWLKSRIDAKE